MTALMKKHASIVLALCLVILTLAVFWQVTRHEFVNYDDNLYVGENPHVLGGLTGDGAAWAFTTFHAANWHPLTWVSLMLDVSLFGKGPMGFHLMNLLLHIANVLLLFVLLSRLAASSIDPPTTGVVRGSVIWPSAFVAALFAIHPLHVESVAWVAERKDVLSTLFWLLTILAYIRYTRKPSIWGYALVASFFAFGLLAKPMLVTLPFVLLLIDYWPLGRFGTSRRGGLQRPPETGVGNGLRPVPGRVRDRGRTLRSGPGGTRHAPTEAGGARKPSPAALVWEKVPLLVLSIGSCAVTFAAQHTGGAMASAAGVPVGIRIENALVACMMYIVKMVVPIRLAVFYPYSASIPAWEVAASVLVLGGISFLAYRTRASRPYLAVGWLWYLITLIPVIGLVQVGQQSMADRYTYVPLIGLFMGIAYGSMGVWEYGGKRSGTPTLPRSHTPILSLIVIAALSVVAWRQAGYWKDNNTLFTHTLAVTTGNYMAHANLGVALYDAGKLDQALEHFRAAVEMKPNEARAQYSLGTVLMKLGHSDEAIEHLETAVRLNNNLIEAHINLGVVYARLGQRQEAAGELKEALRLDPENADIRRSLQKALGGKAGPDAATESALGDDAMRVNRWNEAIEHYSRVLELMPDRAQVRNNLAAAYYYAGIYDKAWEQIRLCRKYGGAPSPELIRLLSEKMPEP